MTQTYPMEFTMKVNMDNAAFEDPKQELIRILADEVVNDLYFANEGTCIDHNGNTVGSWEITGPNPHEEEEE